MIKNIHVHEGKQPVPLQYQSVSECPMCHITLDPTVLHEIITTDETGKFALLSVLSFCRKCRSTFLSIYEVVKDEEFFRQNICFDTKLLQSVPLTPVSQDFSEKIAQTSPRFVDIYNQAYQAEQLHLSDICGMGYRKALEFLIKDFLIYKSPDDKNKIESMPLSQCVKRLHEINSSMAALANVAVWLGNDETHFIRKHMDYDISNLKQFIQATVQMIDLQFTIEEAISMQAQK